MLALIGLLLLVWLILIIVGAVVHGLLWLLIIGVILFLATAAYGVVRRRAGHL